MTIYIDVVLVENLIMNYIILFATGIILKKEIIHKRLILSSLLGAIYSIIAYISDFKIYSSIILKVILSILIVYIAYNPQNITQLWKDVLIFYLSSFVFGGAAFAFIYIMKPQEILMKNGLFLGTYPIKTIFLGSTIAFIIIITAFRIVKSKITQKDMFCDLEIVLNKKKIEVKAMIDTGNLLKEPITNTPVIVVEHTLLYECMSKEILDNLDKILGGDFNIVSDEIKNQYMAKLKCIPFSSLGKENGMLLGIKPDIVNVIIDGNIKKVEKVIIGIYNKSLTKRGEYRALIGMELWN